jgi:hypothetical protein
MGALRLREPEALKINEIVGRKKEDMTGMPSKNRAAFFVGEMRRGPSCCLVATRALPEDYGGPHGNYFS